METVIRQADINDLETLMSWRMEVLREVFGIPSELDMRELEQANRSYYQTMLKNEGHIACFACQGDIIGCGSICIYQEMPSPDNPTGMCAYLMNIFTLPQFRGQGVGELIVRWRLSQAMRRGITKIYLETSDSGRKLYQKIGFTSMTDYLKLDKSVFEREGIIL